MSVFATSPAHAPARDVRAQIEAIAALLRESTSAIDRKGIADRLARAVRALYAVLDTGLEAPAHQDGLVESTRVLAEARQMLAALPPAAADPSLQRAMAALEATHAQIARASEEIIDLMLARRGDLRGSYQQASAVTTRSFQASLALPRLHMIARTPVAPTLSLDGGLGEDPRRVKLKAPPKPATIEELRAAAKPAPEPVTEPDLGSIPESEEDLGASAREAPPLPGATAPLAVSAAEGEILRRLAHDCLEDIASLRALRKPIPGETWLDQSPFEQRLLDNVDAFVALGETALPGVTLFHAEAPAPDPARGFAVALTLGCIEGTDTVDVAIATMKQSAPEELPGFVEGFTLAPSPAIDAELAWLLDAPNPALVGVALEVLGARGSLPLDAPERVLPRRAAVLTKKLAAALGRALPKTKACTVLTNLLDEAPDDELFAIACSALLRRGDGAVRQRLRDAVRARSSTLPIAARLLALSGRQDDLPVLLEGLAAAPSAALVSALGRYGHVDAVSALIGLLDSPDEALGPAAAEALDFITNAGLRVATEVPWTPGVAPPDGSPPPTRTISMPIVDRLTWERWHAQARGRLDPRMKLRGGLPFTPSMIVDELEGAAPPTRRLDAALELVIATGVGTRLTTTDWVARQQQQLAELRDHVRSLGSSTGAWWFAGAAVTSR